MQDDWANYTAMTKAIGGKVQIVGDDLLVTNPKRIKEASAKAACNALLLKVNTGGLLFASVLRTRIG
jgi:enolase